MQRFSVDAKKTKAEFDMRKKWILRSGKVQQDKTISMMYNIMSKNGVTCKSIYVSLVDTLNVI